MSTVTTSLYGSPDLGSKVWRQGFNLVPPTTNTSLILQQYTPGSARMNNNSFVGTYDYIQPGNPGFLPLNTTVLGPGGCYPLPLSNFTITTAMAFPILLIADSTGTANTGSPNFINNLPPQLIIATDNVNFLPPGYDSYAFVNTAFINSTYNFIYTTETGGWNGIRNHTFTLGAIPILSAGNATVPTNVKLTLVNPLATFDTESNPEPILNANILYSFTPAAVADVAKIWPQNPTNVVPTIAPIMIQSTGTTAELSNFIIAPGGSSPSINYTVGATGDSLSLWVGAVSIDYSALLSQP